MISRSRSRYQQVAVACHRYQALSGRFRLSRTCSSCQICLPSTANHPIPPPGARQGTSITCGRTRNPQHMRENPQPQHKKMGLTDELKSRARELGFVAVGVTSADPFKEAQQASIERTEAGLMDGLGWWSRERAESSAEPRRRTPAARSVVALAFPHPVPPTGGTADDGPRGRIAGYALGRDYHELLEERMAPLVDLLKY